MERANPGNAHFPADAFVGTADHYVRYRVPYPVAMMEHLLRAAGTSGQGRLLDLACGPGRLALALRGSFEEVWAVDVEPEMIEAGRKLAALRGAGNILWLLGRGEDLEAPAATFDLIVVGEAFHRLDQEKAAADSLRWLKPGGHLSTMGCYSILSAREPWQRIVLNFVHDATGAERLKDPQDPPRPVSNPQHDERVLRQAGFLGVASHRFPVPHTWTLESIQGYLYSTSVCSKRVLGAKAESFERGLSAALLAHDASGVYRETIDWGYTMGSKPR